MTKYVEVNSCKSCIFASINYVEPVKEPFSDWMQPFISYFPPTFFEARNGQLIYGSLVITCSVYGMFSLTHFTHPLYVQEVTHHQFFRAKWKSVGFREMHTFEEAMKIFAELFILNRFDSFVKWDGFRRAYLDGAIFKVEGMD